MHRSARRMLALASGLIVVAVLSTGCSVREVQMWFALRGAPDVSAAQARQIADAINPGISPVGCNPFYAGGCVPDNQAVAHCAGTIGEGPVIRGPLTVTWDAFGLDPDGDNVACAGTNPIGAIDSVYLSNETIVMSGWALDGDSSAPIDVHIYDNGTGRSITADRPRPDLAQFGMGIDHGFSITWPDVASLTQPGNHEICAYAINVGGGSNTLLGCRTIVVPAREFDGSSPDRALPVFRKAHIGGQWVFQVSDRAPWAVDADEPMLGPAAQPPMPGEVYFMVPGQLFCGQAPSLACSDPSDKSGLTFELVDGNGDRIRTSNEANATPSLLDVAIDTTPGFVPQASGVVPFTLLEPVAGPLVLAASADGHPPVYFHVGSCPTWCGGLPE